MFELLGCHTLELDARTPHIHDVAKNLHNVTKNKVMEMQGEALYSWLLHPQAFPDAGAAVWLRDWHPQSQLCSGMESKSVTVVSQLC